MNTRSPSISEDIVSQSQSSYQPGTADLFLSHCHVKRRRRGSASNLHLTQFFFFSVFFPKNLKSGWCDLAGQTQKTIFDRQKRNPNPVGPELRRRRRIQLVTFKRPAQPPTSHISLNVTSLCQCWKYETKPFGTFRPLEHR